MSQHQRCNAVQRDSSLQMSSSSPHGVSLQPEKNTDTHMPSHSKHSGTKFFKRGLWGEDGQ